MKKLKTLLTTLLLTVPLFVFAAPGVGDPVPDFEAKGSDGMTYTAAQFKGKKPLVVAFFPKAFTGG